MDSFIEEQKMQDNINAFYQSLMKKEQEKEQEPDLVANITDLPQISILYLSKYSPLERNDFYGPFETVDFKYFFIAERYQQRIDMNMPNPTNMEDASLLMFPPIIAKDNVLYVKPENGLLYEISMDTKHPHFASKDFTPFGKEIKKSLLSQKELSRIIKSVFNQKKANKILQKLSPLLDDAISKGVLTNKVKTRPSIHDIFKMQFNKKKFYYNFYNANQLENVNLNVTAPILTDSGQIVSIANDVFYKMQLDKNVLFEKSQNNKTYIMNQTEAYSMIKRAEQAGFFDKDFANVSTILKKMYHLLFEKYFENLSSSSYDRAPKIQRVEVTGLSYPYRLDKVYEMNTPKKVVNLENPSFSTKRNLKYAELELE